MLIRASPSFPSPGLGVHAWTAFWNPDGIPRQPRRPLGAHFTGFPMLCFSGSPTTPLIMRNFCSQALPLRYGSMVSWGLRVPEGNTEACSW